MAAQKRNKGKSTTTPLRRDEDNPSKEAILHFLPLFLEFFFPQTHALIDWANGYTPYESELRKLDRRGTIGLRRADLLIQVRLLSGEDAWILLHIEVQATVDADFPRRMFRYHLRAFDRSDLPVISLAVLTDDSPDWRENTFGYDHGDGGIQLRYGVAKLLDWRNRSEELEQSRNPFASFVMAWVAKFALPHDLPGALRAKIAAVRKLYDCGLDADGVREMFRVVDWILTLPRAEEAVFESKLEQIEKQIDSEMDAFKPSGPH